MPTSSKPRSGTRKSAPAVKRSREIVAVAPSDQGNIAGDIITTKKVEDIRRQLKEMRKHGAGRSSKDLEALAKALRRYKDPRGKEPTWVREREPHLSPPLSIPHHSRDMPIGTCRSIVNSLLDDCDEWDLYLLTMDKDECDD